MVEEVQQSRRRSYPASCDPVLLDLPPFAELPSHELTLLPITLILPSKYVLSFLGWDGRASQLLFLGCNILVGGSDVVTLLQVILYPCRQRLLQAAGGDGRTVCGELRCELCVISGPRGPLGRQIRLGDPCKSPGKFLSWNSP
jgi:hypothetical protein